MARIYAEEWATKLQEQLDEPTKWKDVCRVEYTDTRVIHNPYHVDSVVQSGTRGCPYNFIEINETDESTTINTYREITNYIDRADLAQSTLYKQMEIAQRQGVQLDENIEAAMFTQIDNSSNSTLLGGDAIGGAAGSITPSTTNIDDIVRAVKREIREANGESLMRQYGAFIVWRPQDLEKLEAFMQANGFVMADKALAGMEKGYGGFDYMGVTHFSSNLTTSTSPHLFAGVKKQLHLGIVKATYGQIVINQNPDRHSGISVHTRVDYVYKTWNNTKTVLFRIPVV